MMIDSKALWRLHATIRDAGLAIDTLDVDGHVQPVNLQVSAQPIIDAFDQSVEAQATWDAGRESESLRAAWFDSAHPEIQSLKQLAAQAVADNKTFVAITNPTAAQLSAQVMRLTRQNIQIIQLIVGIIQQ